MLGYSTLGLSQTTVELLIHFLCNVSGWPPPELRYLFYKFKTLWFFDAEGVIAFGALDFAWFSVCGV